MNYRHEFHAGNFADVFKHVVLVRILIYLQRKPAPFRFIDTHAGSGRYDLGGGLAGRFAEWQGGIGRLEPASMESEPSALIEPYVACVSDAMRGRAPYPGSPALALALARPFDRLIFCELQPSALAALKALVGRDRRAKAIALDGYTGLNAFVPPVERRGLVLIDPPFEAPDEFERVTKAILATHRKWREGILVAWFPIKDRRGVERLSAALASAGLPEIVRLEFAVDAAMPEGPLVRCGLIVVNAPYVLEAEMGCILPVLVRQLGQGRGSCSIDRIAAAR